MTPPNPGRYGTPDSQEVARRLARPAADPMFRASLRAAFVTGTIPERHVPPLLRLVRNTRFRVFAGATTIAAAAAVVTALWLNPGPAWQVLGTSGAGALVIDGRPVALESYAEIEPLLRAGARITLPADSQLDLALPGIARVQIVGGSEVVLPASPGRWHGRAVVGSLAAGELRITTGPRFHGTRLAIETPETRVVVTGTTLAVFRLPDASCVCVLEGKVSMSGAGAHLETVRAGFRQVVYRDGRAPLVEPIRPMEAMKLEMLRAQAEAADTL